MHPSSSTARSVCLVHLVCSVSSLDPSHFMQEWGYLRDTASKEKISFSTINCESDRRKRREGSVEGCPLGEEKGTMGKAAVRMAGTQTQNLKLIFAKASVGQ